MKDRWLLDLFCGAGGCTKGYQMAGFKVRGVDLHAQPRYIGEQFIQADALEYLAGLIESGEIEEFDAIHASPPCQAYSKSTAIHKRQVWKKNHPDLVRPIRQLLGQAGLPYVVENVEGSPLVNAIMLCGTMFGLQVYRHRLFESNQLLLGLPHRRHLGSTGSHRGFSKDAPYICVAGHNFSVSQAQKAMCIDWMGQKGLAQAIPPAYTEFIGRQLMAIIDRQELLEERRAA